MDDAVRRALELFAEKGEKLSKMNFLKSIKDLKFSITTKGDGTTFNMVGPTDEERDAFVLTFRLFIQDNDGFSLRWLARNALSDSALSDDWKRVFVEVRDEFKAALADYPPWRVEIEGIPSPTWGDLLHIFIYGDLSHIDPDKRRKLDVWSKVASTRGVLEFQFMQLIAVLAAPIIYLGKQCQLELERHHKRAD